MSEIAHESRNEDFLKPQQREELHRKFREEVASKSQQKGVKQSMKQLHKMKMIRLDLEKLRMMSSFVMRREKFKSQIVESKSTIFSEKTEILQQKWDQQHRPLALTAPSTNSYQTQLNDHPETHQEDLGDSGSDSAAGSEEPKNDLLHVYIEKKAVGDMGQNKDPDLNICLKLTHSLPEPLLTPPKKKRGRKKLLKTIEKELQQKKT